MNDLIPTDPAGELAKPAAVASLTHSSTQCFRTCPRKYWLQYIQLLRPAYDSDALRIGSAFHIGIEVAKNGGTEDESVAEVYETYRKSIRPPWSTEEDFSIERETSAAMVRGWCRRWAGDTIVKYIAAEQIFDLPIINPATGRETTTYRNRGKIDAIVQLPDNRMAIMEHKCVAGSSQLLNHITGKYETADSLYADNGSIMVSAMAIDGSICSAVVRPIRPAGVRHIREIRTNGGRLLRVSGNHPVFTQRGWVLAESLTCDDWAAIPKRIETNIPDAPITDEEIRLIGYMIGDGSLKNSVRFTKTDERVLSDVLFCAASIGETATINRPLNRAPNIRFSKSSGIFKKAGNVYALMQRASIFGCLSGDKRLPFDLSFSDRQMGQLVGALWSCDGCIDARQTKSGNQKLRIIYTSVSDQLCIDLQNSLQRLGIVSNVRRTSVAYLGKRRSVSTVQVVSREGKKKFLQLASDETIPITRSKVSIEDAATMIPSSLQQSDSSMQPVESHYIWWDRIESVRWGGREQTYDITVPIHHTFVVDGIVTHNTASVDLALGGDYWKRLALDSQISRYFLAARSLGFDVKTTLFDVTRKPLIRPKNIAKADRAMATSEGNYFGVKLTAICPERETPELYAARLVADMAERPDWYFARTEIPRLEEDLNEFAAESWTTQKQIRDCELNERQWGRTAWPRNTQACTAMYRCQMLDICRGLTGDPSEQVPEGFVKATVAHKELT